MLPPGIALGRLRSEGYLRESGNYALSDIDYEGKNQVIPAEMRLSQFNTPAYHPIIDRF
jgi:hypothetical protein